MSIKRRRGREIYDRSIAIYEKPSRHNGAGSGRRGKGAPPKVYRPPPQKMVSHPWEWGAVPAEIRWFLFDLLILRSDFEKRNERWTLFPVGKSGSKTHGGRWSELLPVGQHGLQDQRGRCCRALRRSCSAGS